jgi:hypothetical protein
MHFCPHPECDYRGWLGLHNLRANGHPGGGRGGSSTASAATGIFQNITARLFMASKRQWN